MDVKKCPGCGMLLKKEAKFCFECGMRQFALRPEETTPPEEEAEKITNESAETETEIDEVSAVEEQDEKELSEPEEIKNEEEPEPEEVPEPEKEPAELIEPEVAPEPEKSYNYASDDYKVEKGSESDVNVTVIVLIVLAMLLVTLILMLVIDSGKRRDTFSMPDNSVSESSVIIEEEPHRGGEFDEESDCDEDSYIEHNPGGYGAMSVPDYYTDGVYKIGTDIPEGLYLLQGFLLCTDENEIVSDAKYTIYSDEECTDQLDGCWFQFTRYVELKGDGYAEFTFCEAFPVGHPDIVNDPFVYSGMFIVGEDVEPGTYRLKERIRSGNPMRCHIYDDMSEVYGYSLYNDPDSIVQDGDIITLEDGQILEMEWCILEREE